MQEGEQNKRTLARPRTFPELVNFIQLEGVCVGSVTSSVDHSDDVGKPVWAVECFDGSIQLRILGLAVGKNEAIECSVNMNPEEIGKKLNLLRMKCVAVDALFKMFLIDGAELDQVRRDTRLLCILYGLCKFYQLLGGVPIVDDERNVVPRTYLANKTWAKPLLVRFQREYPEAAASINEFSLARAAGYVMKFQQVIKWELNGNADNDPKRFDLLLVQACERFWKSKDGASVGPKAIFPRTKDLDTWAREYRHAKGSTWMTQARLEAHAYPPIITSFKDIKKLQALSLIFAKINETRPPTIRQGRKDYKNPHGTIEEMPKNKDMIPWADPDEAEIYLGPVIYTKHWFTVLNHFRISGGDTPQLPVNHDVPGWGPGDIMTIGGLARVKIYEAYVQKCKKFESNASVHGRF